jgi:hypothetical protein
MTTPTAPDTADLEIGLHKGADNQFTVELRFHVGAADTIERATPNLDFDALSVASRADEDAALSGKPRPNGYGRLLFDQVFADERVRVRFAEAVAVAQARGLLLRVRLFVGPTAPELHSLRWELLTAPDGTEVSTGEKVRFSRYLGSADWRPVQLRPSNQLRALVVVASPKALANYPRIKPIDVDAAFRRAAEVLPVDKPIQVRGPGTLGQLTAALSRESYDVLCLVCHGVKSPEESTDAIEPDRKSATKLVFEGLANDIDWRDSGDLVHLLTNLGDRRPALVLLCSCYSAGDGGDDAARNRGDLLSAVGPRLAGAGVPAVLAMQGAVTMTTADRFLTGFFARLRETGCVDEAAAVGRLAVADRPDRWMPVVFSRLRDGRIWETPPPVGAGMGERFDKWDGLLTAIGEGECTAILGWGLLDGLIGGSREVARRWAADKNVTMYPNQREDLPQVAQYLGTVQGMNYPRKGLTDRLRGEIRRHASTPLAVDAASESDVDDMFEELRTRRRTAGWTDPFDVLGRLPVRLYLSTTPDRQLARAIRSAGRKPVEEVCPWHDRNRMKWPTSVYTNKPDHTPTKDAPVVYQLYGRLDHPRSLVLTEDDYFDFLIGVNSDQNRIPPGIKTMFEETVLLFLGFRIDEWDFRVLFRSILSQGDKWELNRDYKHVAVQIEPAQDRAVDPAQVRNYLREYFQEGSSIHIFWGTPEEFLRQLGERWDNRNTGGRP